MTTQNLREAVISLGQEAAAWFTGDPDDARAVDDPVVALMAIRQALTAGQASHNELIALKHPKERVGDR